MEFNENVAEDTNVTDNFDEKESTQEPADTVDNSQDTETDKPVDEEEKSEELILGKFKTNEDLINAYSENEKQLGKMSNELGELRKVKEEFEKLSKERNDIAKAYGFDSAEEMQQASVKLQEDQDVVNFTADEYAKHINECEFPEEMRNLLLKYKQNPTPELLETIEDEFSKQTLKDVERNLTLRKGQLAFQRQQALDQQQYEAVVQFMDDVTAKYADDRYFGNEAFKELFADLFKSFGTDLKTDYAIEKLEKYVQSRISAANKKKASNNENSQATDAIEGLSGEAGSEANSKSLLEMDEAELRRVIRKLK